MKKTFLILLTVAVCVVATAVVFIPKSDAEKLMEANVKALAEGIHTGSSSYNICYYESRVKVGYTYYDCMNCKVKVYDEQGRGRYSKCFY